MKTSKNILIIAGFFLIFNSSKAQEKEGATKTVRPFQITFITPIGTNGTGSYRIANEFSLNILAGVNGGSEAFELGGLLNIDHGDVEKFQLAGFGNVVSGSVNAVQIAGFSNINGGLTEGVQVGGFINISGGYAHAGQVAGFGNVSSELDGAQASGFFNVSGNSKGLQAGGFVNVGKDLNGAQVSGFTNIAENVDGLQATGFINVAKKVKGLQLAGFINICDTIDGIPIAPISIVRKGGYQKFELSMNESLYLNAGYKIGIRKFYTLFSLGIKPGISDYRWSIGYGAGTSMILGERSSFDIEGHVYHFQDMLLKNWEYNQLNQLNLIFNFQVAEHFSFFAGPSFNLLITKDADSSYDIAPAWAFKIAERRNYLSGWFGFNAGFRL